ncbi:TetR/AcrR family transcriptional regulator [Sphingomonas sp. SRS2]|uniref:TetR/AcrR family transcriptional regulator n=1 Tax=Sphingomonas sp. SRS2 TaxID=133190 RepID=UPI000618420F|nr:TetR/AcrR family transcriptional regulator [Sphingomonas sp. SRS2]KKC26343.1 TetR family transcriptional regulator [Sphingomonas sp. SRS2]
MAEPTPKAPIDTPFPSKADRQREREAKRQAVLLAAVRMFNERGFRETSLDDVAASLGVTKPVLYHYYGNKDQILFACVDAGLAQLRPAAARARALPGTGLDRLKAFLIDYAAINMTDFGRIFVLTRPEALSAESGARLRDFKREIDGNLRELIAGAAADGSAVVGDVKLTAFALAGALNWPARWFQENGEHSAPDVARALVGTLCAGLEPRPGGA